MCLGLIRLGQATDPLGTLGLGLSFLICGMRGLTNPLMFSIDSRTYKTPALPVLRMDLDPEQELSKGLDVE